DVELVCRGLHQLGRGFQRRMAQLPRRHARGLAAHHGDTRGEGAHAAGDAVGLAVHDVDGLVGGAERLGTDLRHHGLDALADRGVAGDDLDAVLFDLDADRVERTEPALLDEHGDTGADLLALRAPRLYAGLQLEIGRAH